MFFEAGSECYLIGCRRMCGSACMEPITKASSTTFVSAIMKILLWYWFCRKFSGVCRKAINLLEINCHDSQTNQSLLCKRHKNHVQRARLCLCGSRAYPPSSLHLEFFPYPGYGHILQSGRRWQWVRLPHQLFDWQALGADFVTKHHTATTPSFHIPRNWSRGWMPFVSSPNFLFERSILIIGSSLMPVVLINVSTHLLTPSLLAELSSLIPHMNCNMCSLALGALSQLSWKMHPMNSSIATTGGGIQHMYHFQEGTRMPHDWWAQKARVPLAMLVATDIVNCVASHGLCLSLACSPSSVIHAIAAAYDSTLVFFCAGWCWLLAPLVTSKKIGVAHSHFQHITRGGLMVF